MIVNVSEIGDGGLSLDLKRGPGWLGGSEKSEVASVDSDIEFHIDLLRTAGEISVRGKIGFLAAARCSRCLSDVSVDTNLEVKLILSPSETERKEEAGGEIDYETYRGRKIDLNDYMREQVNLSLPYKVLCAEDCRGLCSECGQNLNEQRCGCETHQKDSRFAVLKNIKI